MVLDPRDFPDVLRIERMRAKADNLVAGSCVLLFLGVVALGLDVLDLAGTCICTGLGWVAILWLPAVLFTLALDLWIMSGCVREGVETRTVGFLAGLRMGDW